MKPPAHPFYITALNMAKDMLEATDIEPRSALKQAASDAGIPYGDDMGRFVEWAEEELGIAPKRDTMIEGTNAIIAETKASMLKHDPDTSGLKDRMIGAMSYSIWYLRNQLRDAGIKPRA